MTDAELIQAFEDGTLVDLPHRAHVRVAWVYLGEAELVAAAARFIAGLKRFAAARGVPGLYHETITWAYLLWIHERRRRTPGGDFDAFADANPELLEPHGLRRFYRDETLESPEARRSFVLPDRERGWSAAQVET